MKHIITLAFVGTLLSACTNWTEPESIDFTEPNIESQNPDLYANYLSKVRNYKTNIEHKQVYVWFDNSSKSPVNRAQHLTEIPDSVDAVILDYPDKLAEWELNEITKIRNEKATKVLCPIDFDAIKVAYNAKQNPEATPEILNGEPEAEAFNSFLIDTLAYCMSTVNQYSYDGLSIQYKGKLLINIPYDEQEEYKANERTFMGIMNDWILRNLGKTIVFVGDPQNLIDTSILNSCKSVLTSGEDAKDETEFTFKLSAAACEGVPTDRLGLVISAPLLNEPNKEVGYFANGNLMFDSIGKWTVASHSGLSAAAVGIRNVSTDYFNVDCVYKRTRALISTINPSIK